MSWKSTCDVTVMPMPHLFIGGIYVACSRPVSSWLAHCSPDVLAQAQEKYGGHHTHVWTGSETIGLFHPDLQGWCFMTGVPDKGYRGWYKYPAHTTGNPWIWRLLEMWENVTQQFWQTHTNRDRVQPETNLTILPLVTFPTTFHAHVAWGTQVRKMKLIL